MSGQNGSNMEVAAPGTPPAELKSFQERLSEIPLYTMTLSQLSTIYSTLKDKNQYLNSALTTGEKYYTQVTEAALPVVKTATDTALKAAKPVVGEVTVGTLDHCASEALAKVQEKLPIVNQTPAEMAQTARNTARNTAESAKVAAQETAIYYMGKLNTSTVGKQTTKQLDNAVSFSELMVEICFPTDGSNADDLKELEKAEEDEDKGLVVRAGNLKDRALRRGSRKLMSYKPVKTTVDNVQYAQERINEVTQTVMRGTQFVTSKSAEAKELLIENYPTIKTLAGQTLIEGKELINKNWDNIYSTTMYIPKKAIQVTGEVYVNAQEVVFAYTKAHSLTEVPHAVVEMAEKYYADLKLEGLTVDQVKEKAVAFVYVPAQFVSEYIQKTRIVQWVVPKSIEAESIELVETVSQNEKSSEASSELDTEKVKPVSEKRDGTTETKPKIIGDTEESASEVEES